MTRAMFASVIGRLYERSYGQITTTGSGNKFTDVDTDAYYGGYVDWAAEKGIITGVGDGKFEPDREITREEMALILYRFAKFLNVSVTESGEIQLSYPDASDISSWTSRCSKVLQANRNNFRTQRRKLRSAGHCNKSRGCGYPAKIHRVRLNNITS